jgi:hypothetical protein
VEAVLELRLMLVVVAVLVVIKQALYRLLQEFLTQ